MLRLNEATGKYEPERGISEGRLRAIAWVSALVIVSSVSGMAYGVARATSPSKSAVRSAQATQEPRAAVVPLDGDSLAPEIGGVRFGAYAGEAALVAGLSQSSIPALSNPEAYRKYRQSVRDAYGVDLEDMNYFSVGAPGWESRLTALRQWLLSAGEFGEVTIALEPSGPAKYGVFRESAAMDQLRSIFEEAEELGITIAIRFASEANLRGNPYSVYGSRRLAERFFEAAAWFKNAMPGNVRMVFSPLINTAVYGEPLQRRTIEWMFLGPEGQVRDGVPWDRIGGTIYRTNVRLDRTYATYYARMTALNENLPFQICEVGGPYGKRGEIKNFINHIIDGRWPGVEKVNLFARDINRRADPDGHFGFMDPTERASATSHAMRTGEPQVVESFLKPLFTGQND